MNPLTHPRRGLRAAVLLVAAALALTVACSGDDDGDALADTESVTSSDSASGSGDSGDSAESGDNPDEASDSAAEGDVLGTTRAQHPASAIDARMTPLRIDVTRLERHGDLVELTMQLTNEAEVPTDDSEPQEFSPHSMFGEGSSAIGRYDLSDVGLVDGDSQKLYLPIIDSGDRCLCTTETGSVEVPPGETWTLTATIGGVPDDLEQVDVAVPGFPTITGVSFR